MMKADARKDYYADLGVSPNCDTDELKKQFRKLGEHATAIMTMACMAFLCRTHEFHFRERIKCTSRNRELTTGHALSRC